MPSKTNATKPLLSSREAWLIEQGEKPSKGMIRKRLYPPPTDILLGVGLILVGIEVIARGIAAWIRKH